MVGIAKVLGQLNPKESLHSMLAPYSFGEAEDGILLGWTEGHPFLNEGRNQRLKFFLSASWPGVSWVSTRVASVAMERLPWKRETTLIIAFKLVGLGPGTIFVPVFG
jgi:hypothetical protein